MWFRSKLKKEHQRKRKYSHQGEDIVENTNFITSNFRFANEFSVTRILGIGGIGIVFEAIHNLDQCNYAIKRIPLKPRFEHFFIRIFKENFSNDKNALQEARDLAKLDHPGIVRYNNTWIEKPPEGWQVKISASYIPGENCFKLEADLNMLKDIGSSRILYVRSTLILFNFPIKE